MVYFVEVVDYDTGETIRRIDCGANERRAEKTEAGVNRNINHNQFFTRIVCDDEEIKNGENEDE